MVREHEKKGKLRKDEKRSWVKISTWETASYQGSHKYGDKTSQLTHKLAQNGQKIWMMISVQVPVYECIPYAVKYVEKHISVWEAGDQANKQILYILPASHTKNCTRSATT